ncbi:putative transporter [Trachipleistophora hominis]|uniref:Putative transporter n=1 Tax=Trachipleistophora hominis TaxID=72359 RepID=L7JZR0_TRAHO|nr:putative transporter [Trachipleistophora hominis]
MIPKSNAIYNSNVAFIYVFSLFTLLELSLYGLAVYFLPVVIPDYPFTVYGASLILGNFFLIEAIVSRNIYQICIYPFLYAYTLTVNLLNITLHNKISFAFQMVLISVIVLHGIVFLVKFSDFFYEFTWCYYKKIGGRQEIIRKSKVSN